jgi:hypothetical protein
MMQAVLSELTLREIDQMTRKDLLEAFSGFAEVCRSQPSRRDLSRMSDVDLRRLVCQARRQYCVRGY